jgi:hypothetical protein
MSTRIEKSQKEFKIIKKVPSKLIQNSAEILSGYFQVKLTGEISVKARFLLVFL